MTRPPTLAAALAGVALLAACANGPRDGGNGSDGAPTPTAADAPPLGAETATPPATAMPRPEPPPTATVTPEPADEEEPRMTKAVEEPSFDGAVHRIDGATRARMEGVSWHPDCPVSLDELRLLELAHWDLDGQVRQGELVVHADHAEAVVDVFRQLFDAAFPIAQMRLVDDFGGHDDASMAANNTSAFNCRSIPGRPGVWSQHAYGLAVDVNPALNPYITSAGVVMPPEAEPYVDRSRDEPGMIHPDGSAVRAFASIGWGWGGHWTSSKDYHHFSATGR